MELTDSFLTLLQNFAPVFTAPTYQTFVVIVTGWIISQRHRYGNNWCPETIGKQLVSENNWAGSLWGLPPRALTDPDLIDTMLIKSHLLGRSPKRLYMFDNQILDRSLTTRNLGNGSTRWQSMPRLWDGPGIGF
jgi:hypothetical protein